MMGYISKGKVSEVEKEKKEAKVVEDKEEKPKEEVILVVKEIPTQEVRQTTTEDGKKVTFITIEEALTKLLNK